MPPKGDEKSPILHTKKPEDNTKAAHSEDGLSVLTAAIFVVAQCLGLGLLTLPKAMGATGWGGVFLIVGSCVVAGYTGIILGECWNILSERYPEYREHVREPYALLGQKAFGKWMRYVILCIMYVGILEMGVLYIVLISQNLHSLFGQAGLNLSSCLWMVIAALVVSPFHWFGSPKDFWFIGVVSATTAVLASILLFISFLVQLPVEQDVSTESPWSFMQFFMALGSILFSYGGGSLFPTIQHDMKEPSKFKTSVALGFSILLCMYLPTAVTGYLVNGKSNANVLMSLPHGGLRITIEVLLTIHTFFVLVISTNPLYQQAEEKWNIPKEFGPKRVLLRSIIMLIVLFIAETIPRFGALSVLIGGSFIAVICFAAPPILYLGLCSQSGDWPSRLLPWYKKIINYIIIVIGLVGGVASSCSAIYEIVGPDTFVLPCYINSSQVDQ